MTGNPISDLSGIDELTNLKSLFIGGTQVNDLSPLNDCKSLEYVYVDERQYETFSNDDIQHSFTLILVGPKEEMRDLTIHIFGGAAREWRRIWTI